MSCHTVRRCVSGNPAGQEVVVVAVGPEAYTKWEGYVEEDTGRAVIGLSYDKLCQYVKPGNTILLSDGTITIEVCVPSEIVLDI